MTIRGSAFVIRSHMTTRVFNQKGRAGGTKYTRIRLVSSTKHTKDETTHGIKSTIVYSLYVLCTEHSLTN